MPDGTVSSTVSSTWSGTGLALGLLTEPTGSDDLGLIETSLPTGTTPRAWWWRELRPLLLRVHFYAGLFVGPFLLVSALTGLMYTAAPRLEQLVHHDQLHVTVPAGAAELPLSQQITAAGAAVPEGSRRSDRRSARMAPPGWSSMPPDCPTATSARRSWIRTPPRCATR